MENEIEKVELHHHSIQEIMGAPPAKSIAFGSGIILMIFMVLLICSMFIYFPEVIRVEAILHGQTPVATLTAPETGKIIFENDYSDKQFVQKDETILYIKDNQAGESIPVNVSSSGIFQINPLVRIKQSVFLNDTIGFLWSENYIPTVCVIELPAGIARRVQAQQKIRIFIDENDHKNFIETEIRESHSTSVNQTQFIAVLTSQQLDEKNIYGTVLASAEIITGQKNLFNQLINPFRGLK